MFRWSSAVRLCRRQLHTPSAKPDTLLDQFRRSTNEFHVFQLVGINRHALTMDHVTCAMNLLWRFQSSKPRKLRMIDSIREHPEFSALGVVAENNMTLMEDQELVNILNIVERFHVDAHSSLVQGLVTEGWKRLQRLDLSSLATFAASLKRLNLGTSPLMGQIASIVDARLDNVEVPETLSSFIESLYTVSSPSLQERMISKTESILDKLDVSHLANALRLMDVLHKNKNQYLSLFRKCDGVFQKYIHAIDTETMCSIIRVYKFLRFNNSDFLVGAKPRLMKEVERCDHAGSFVDLFIVLSPMVSEEMRNRMEKKLHSFAEEMSLKNLLDVLKVLADTGCANTTLIQKVCLLLRSHLESCTPDQLCSIVEAVILLGHQDYRLRIDLQQHFKRCIMASFQPSSVTSMITALWSLNPHQIDDAIISKLDDVIAQCNFYDLSRMTFVVNQLLQSSHAPHRRSKTLRTLPEKLNGYRVNRVQSAESIESLMGEMKDKDMMAKMDDALLECTLQTCQRLLHQLSWKNVAQSSTFALGTNVLCAPLLDKISEVAMDNITKIFPSTVYPIVRVFAIMNYVPPEGEAFFHVCARHVLNNLESLSPHFLVLTAYSLAVAGHFPGELIRSIFNIQFLRRLDAQLDAFHYSISSRLRRFLMELNRAVCLEHPEYDVPWFHEQYCQQTLHREESITLHQIDQLMKEVLGDEKYTKMSVRTPYGYFIDFECILDTNRKPISYAECVAHSFGFSKLGPEHQLQENKALPEGAQRCAVEILHPWAFLRNSSHIRGTFEMKKRHLEILGYRVIQIPSYEWKTLETKDAWTNYLREKILQDNV